LRIAQSSGLNEQQFDACVSDEKALKALNDRIERYSKETDIKGTPTFVINGKKLNEDGGEAQERSHCSSVQCRKGLAHRVIAPGGGSGVRDANQWGAPP
ncbi:DsbA family protein, partial [Variovorax sp. 2RAF20]